MLFDFGFISMRWIWVALTVIFAIIEAFTLGLYTIWFALAAIVMVFLSFLNIPPPFQAMIFLALSALLFFVTRPLAVKKFKIGKEKTNVDSLIGKHALVTRTISKFEKGEVKLNGQFWSARAEDDSEVPQGSQCEVIRIEGVQAIVRPIAGEKQANQPS